MEKKRFYSFREYVDEMKIIGDDPPFDVFLRIIWGKYSGAYQDYCKTNNYDFEEDISY